MDGRVTEDCALLAMRRRIDSRGEPPTIAELARGIGTTKGGAQQVIARLWRRGAVERRRGRSRVWWPT